MSDDLLKGLKGSSQVVIISEGPKKVYEIPESRFQALIIEHSKSAEIPGKVYEMSE